MALPPEKAAARLRLIAREARRLLRHGRALADALDGLAADLLDEGPGQSVETRSPRDRRKPQPTQRVVVDLLRKCGADGLTVSELLRQARFSGFDLLRPTVDHALDRLSERGLAKRDLGRWTLTHASGGASAATD